MGRPRKYPEGQAQHVKNQRRKNKDGKERFVPGLGLTRYGYLEKYPNCAEDRENQIARAKGYDDDGIRLLLTAVSLQAVMDYRKALNGHGLHGSSATDLKKDCDAFFMDEFFQYFVNGMKLEEIHEHIRSMNKIRYNIGTIQNRLTDADIYDDEDWVDPEIAACFHEASIVTKVAKGKHIRADRISKINNLAIFARPIIEGT